MIRKIFAGETVANVGGLGIAAALQLCALPIISRLFSPEEYGIFGAAIALASLLATFSAGRYENAIIGAENDEDALIITLCGVGLALLSSAVLLICALGINTFYNNDSGNSIVFAGSFVLATTTLLQVLINSAVRRREFKAMAIARIATATVQLLLTVLAGLLSMGPAGLLSAVALGQCTGLLLLVICATPGAWNIEQQMTVKLCRTAAVKYRRYPLVDAPATVANSLASVLPTLFFISSYGALVTGQLTMVMRFWAGTGILSKGLGETFRAKARHEYQCSGQFRESYVSTAGPLSVLSLFIACGMMVVAPNLFVIILGDEWGGAGKYAQILAPALSVQLLASTMSSSFYVSNNLTPLMMWRMLLLLVQFCVLMFATIALNPESALIALSVSMIILYAIYFILSYREAIKGANHHLKNG